MLLIYGLGNHQDKYLKTKHNVGRLVLENLASKLGLNFKQKDNYFIAENKEELDLEKLDYKLIYSKGFMNDSGLPLKAFLKNLKQDELKNLRLLILQDDSDQLVGFYKLVVAGGSAGHHGIESVYKQIIPFGITKEQIWRLKIGIRPIGNTQRSETFVLASVSFTEMEKIEQIATKIYTNFDLFRKQESKILNFLQTIFNTKDC